MPALFLLNREQLRSRVYLVPSKSVSPQRKLFCGGKSVDYKRRQAVGLRESFIRRRDGGRTKPCGFVLPLPAAAATVRLRRTATALVRIAVSLSSYDCRNRKRPQDISRGCFLTHVKTQSDAVLINN